MSYFDRLRTCRYTSPSGKFFVLAFDDLGRSGGRKAAIHELPQQDQPDIQDLGILGARFTLALYLTGTDYDQIADSFYGALEEHGAGVLEHPRYGDLVVVPLTWGMEEKFVEGAGRADFNIEFIKYQSTAAFPIIESAPTEAIADATADASMAAMGEFLTNYSPVDAKDIAACKGIILGLIDSAKSALAQLSNGVDSVTREINAQHDAIASQIDSLISTPNVLFASLQSLYNTATDLPIKISAKVQSYANLILGVLDGLSGTSTAQASVESAISGIIAIASSRSTVSGLVISRQDAVHVADLVSEIRTAKNEIGEKILSEIPDYTPMAESSAALEMLMVATVDAILNASFNLKSERKYIVPYETPPILLVWQFYKDVSDKLIDDFIAQNNLKGLDILMVPSGREVVYYA